MTDNRITRVHYFERQYLGAQDFNDEQAYHVAMRRRHNITQHSWGIVRGLELEFNEKDNAFVVRPGVAVDGFGRELILFEPRQYEVNVFDTTGSDKVDLWLEYRKRSNQSSAAQLCPVDEDAAYDRWLELPEIVLRTNTINDADRRLPPKVSPADKDFNATRTPPDSDERFFPVFLGQMRRTMMGRQVSYSVALTGRPYAGLVGSTIQHPAGKVRVVLGRDEEAYFAVNLGDDDDTSLPALEIQEMPAAAGQPDITFNGNVKVTGDVTVSGAVNFTAPQDTRKDETGQAAVSTKAETSAPPPPTPHPGDIYLTPPDAKSNLRELRFELGNSDSEPTRFAVGVWSEEVKDFKPILVVDENGVTITGTLVAKVDKPDEELIARPTDEVLDILRNRRLTGRPLDAGLGDVLDKYLKIVNPQLRANK